MLRETGVSRDRDLPEPTRAAAPGRARTRPPAAPTQPAEPADAPAPWYADGLRFGCTQCGRCCGGAPGYVWVTDEEIERIAARLQLSADEFRERHTRKAAGWRRSLLELRNGDCEFLARDDAGKARCTIYEDRPVQCRTWPFWKSNVESLADWQTAAKGCPGIGKGEQHPLPVIEAALLRNGSLPL